MLQSRFADKVIVPMAAAEGRGIQEFRNALRQFLENP